ncbi:MAG TPA: hypothetical protein VEX38_10415, partial [Fimbriimonadaceae bacterium]|nr:hypothetical protein [Fimbriimonadaceae bacterium]
SYSGGHVVVFRSSTAEVGRSLVQRFSPSGTPVDQEPIELVPGNSGLKLIWNGRIFLVAYNDTVGGQPRIMARRLSESFTWLDSAPKDLMRGVAPVGAALGDKFLVVGLNDLGYFHTSLPFGVRVHENGTVLDANAVQLSNGFVSAHDVAPLGNRWLIAFQLKASHDNNRKRVSVQWLPEVGGVPAESYAISPLSFVSKSPRIGSKGDSAVVVYEDGADGSNQHDIFARQIFADGSMPQLQYNISNLAEVTNETREYFPTITWDGAKYVVAWLDHRRDAWPKHNVGDIYGTRLDANGAVLDPAGIQIAAATEAEATPHLASNAGNLMLAYTRFMPTAPFASYRVMTSFAQNSAPRALESLQLSSGSVAGGEGVTGTVTLTVAAPAGGTVVNLSDNTSAVNTPATVTVAAGSRSANFPVTTTPVGGTYTREVYATLASVTKTARLTLEPAPKVSAVSANPSTVEGGATTTGTVTLTAVAPTGGATVSLSSNSSALIVSGSVVVPAGATSATFQIRTAVVGADYTRYVSANYGGVTRQVAVTITKSSPLSSITANPSTVKGGQSTTGTVTLSAPAPAGGAVVTLSSGSSAITVPGTVTVPAGASSVTFTITTARVGATATRYITASRNNVSRNVAITLTP